MLYWVFYLCLHTTQLVQRAALVSNFTFQFNFYIQTSTYFWRVHLEGLKGHAKDTLDRVRNDDDGGMWDLRGLTCDWLTVMR